MSVLVWELKKDDARWVCHHVGNNTIECQLLERAIHSFADMGGWTIVAIVWER